MHILIAPDSFKESLTAIEVANAIEIGFKQIMPEAQYTKIPVADGGEGTMQAIVDAKAGKIISALVQDPLGRVITAHYGWIEAENLAVIEMAEASGLMLLHSSERNPLITSSYGTGELILDALNRGATTILLAIGGSATNDGGMGMLSALGVQFLDQENNILAQGGAALSSLARIDLRTIDERLAQVSFEVACDVDNPLCGERGSSAVFGPQKGASQDDVSVLDAALMQYADIAGNLLQKDFRDHKGAGAAGGMGFAAIAFLKGKLLPGITLVLETVNFDEIVKTVDLVITGEGKIDEQTIFGKTPVGVAKMAKRYHKPVIAIAGSLGQNYMVIYDHGIDVVFSISPKPEPLENALLSAHQNIVDAARNIAGVMQLKERMEGK